MKKYLYCLLVTIVVACHQEPVDYDKAQNDATPNQTVDKSKGISLGRPAQGENATVYSSVFDDSGLLETKVWSLDFDWPGNAPNGFVEVPGDYVLIGGGAWPMGQDLNKGAYLTESRPDWPANRWYAASKDHIHPDSHVLRVCHWNENSGSVCGEPS